MWQENVGQAITAHLLVEDGLPVETGSFILDGVPFSAAQIILEFFENTQGTAYPTGRAIDTLNIPGLGDLEVTLVRSGSPTVFVNALQLGLTGRELHEDFACRPDLPSVIESIRCEAGVRMGIASTLQDIGTTFPHTPRVAIVSPPQSYTTSAGSRVHASEVDLLVRIMSLGKLHHAMTGTGAVALAVASATPDTVVSRITRAKQTGVRFGHPSGTTEVGADVFNDGGRWKARSIVMTRSARRLMSGEVFFPASVLEQSTDGDRE
jgi:2-methylaconitate cis-trans-isomerase PrpF